VFSNVELKQLTFVYKQISWLMKINLKVHGNNENKQLMQFSSVKYEFGTLFSYFALCFGSLFVHEIFLPQPADFVFVVIA